MTLFRDSSPSTENLSAEDRGVGQARRSRARPAPARKSLRQLALDEKSDLELIEMVKAGERRAFDALVQRHQQMVISTLLRMMDMSDAQDVAQDAFIKAYRSIASFRGDSQFATWLYRIASNTAMNHLKLRRRRPGPMPLDGLDGDFVFSDAVIDHNSPEDFVIAGELEGLLQRRLARMKPDLRQALMSYEIEGMSYQEIADSMDCPVGTIRSRISRGREILNHDLCLHGYDPLSPDFQRSEEAVSSN